MNVHSKKTNDRYIDVGLMVLSRGIEHNRENSDIWWHYLNLYARREDAVGLDQQYLNALELAPSYSLFWKVCIYMESCSSFFLFL